MRNGTQSFSVESSPYLTVRASRGILPADTSTRGDNNHDFGGLTITGDGNTSCVLVQAAMTLGSGSLKKTERYYLSSSTISLSQQHHGTPESLSDLFHCTIIHGKGLQEPQGCNISGNIPSKTDKFSS
jgi:hypothetical protein